MVAKKISKKILSHDLYFRPLLPAVLVFFAFMIIIGLSWHTARQDIVTQKASFVNQSSSYIESTLYQRFTVYENSLRAANGLFLSSDNVTRAEWKEFITSLDLSRRYPGIRGLGFIKVISANDKDAFEQSNRQDYLPNYTVYPTTDRATLAPLQYVVPLGDEAITTDHTAPALGFDMYSDPERATAMRRAAETGDAALSGIVNLVKNVNNQTSKGFLLFLPLYNKGADLHTKEQRLAALTGYFYAPFMSDGVFKSLFTNPNQSFGFTIYNGSIESQNQLYKTSTLDNLKGFKEIKTSRVELLGQDWNIVYKIRDDAVPYSVRARPLSVLIGGGIFSAALAVIIYLLIQRRTRTLAYVEQKKLEEAKDELLSLASHQLRTPATAVKQYVSMVKEGFAGDLTPDQQKLLQMAYESNERQLTIVDDLLYVARVDAGKATLKPEIIDIAELITSVISEQQSIVQSRKQSVIYKASKKVVAVEADPQYLRMILENLLSNASKYSYERKEITLQVQNGKSTVTVQVSDKGVGIDEADYEDVFMKFSRIPNELTRQTSGSGIGLYLAKQLALLHDGDLTFRSKPGHGTTFTLVLPKKRP